MDKKIKNGEPFWKLPKRPPTAVSEFIPEDEFHSTFVSALSVLLAKKYGIAYPEDFRTKEGKRKIS